MIHSHAPILRVGIDCSPSIFQEPNQVSRPVPVARIQGRCWSFCGWLGVVPEQTIGHSQSALISPWKFEAEKYGCSARSFCCNSWHDGGR